MNIAVPNKNDTLSSMNQNSFLHPFSSIKEQQENGSLMMETAEGCIVRDKSGKEYFDAASGLWCVNVGYGREEISKAIYEQSCKLSYFHSFNSTANEASISLSNRLLQKAPKGMKRVFYGTSGSDANDTAIKILWTYNHTRGKPSKNKVISREYGYHGVTMAAGSVTGIPMVHKHFGLPLDFAKHVSRPDMYRGIPEEATEEEYSQHLAKELEITILSEGPETVAGFIAEPVMGTGGVFLPPKGYFKEIQKVLDKYDVCMIADEVITAFGRTGSWFASDKYTIKPDLVTTAKGLTSGYLPLSAVLVGEKIWDVLDSASADGRPFAHGFTYSAHPVCCAAANANLNILERENLIQRVNDISPYFNKKLNETLRTIEIVGDIRSTGLMMGIEIVADKKSKSPFPVSAKAAARIALCAREMGLLIRALPNSDVIALSPAFIVTNSEIDTLTMTLKVAIEQIEAQLHKEGLLSMQRYNNA